MTAPRRHEAKTSVTGTDVSADQPGNELRLRLQGRWSLAALPGLASSVGMTQSLTAGRSPLATGNVAAHFDAAIPPLKPALRLPAAVGASTLIATTWWKRRHHRQLPPRFRGRVCRHRGISEQHEGPSEGAYATP